MPIIQNPCFRRGRWPRHSGAGRNPVPRLAGFLILPGPRPSPGWRC